MIIVLNNKCNLNKIEFMDYQNTLGNIKTNSKIILCPNYLNISDFYLKNIILGSQNVSKYDDGAATGEISANLLNQRGVKYSIVGHSERRKYQHETEEDINEKVKRLLQKDIIPILCIGEEKEEKEKNKTIEVILEQLDTALKDINETEKVIIAYEPIWSIGTGQIPSNEEIELVIEKIKERYPNNIVIYGGSANEQNINELKKIKIIDGFLLGGLSLDPKKLQNFINVLEEE